MANDDFSEPPRRADSKNPIFFFDFWVWVTSKAWGSDSVGFWGSCQLGPFWGRGGPAGGLYRPPPPGNENPASPIPFKTCQPFNMPPTCTTPRAIQDFCTQTQQEGRDYVDTLIPVHFNPPQPIREECHKNSNITHPFVSLSCLLVCAWPDHALQCMPVQEC